MKESNWYVITGAPSSGKTTVLKRLKKLGYRTIDEAARVYIDREIQKGSTIQEIRADEALFQENVLQMKVEIEAQLQQEETIFFDRGIPDTIAYLQLIGKNDDLGLKKALKNCKYKKVFLLEMLKFEKDYARTEDHHTAKKLEQLLEESYKNLGFQLVKVPFMTVSKRLTFVLENL